MGLETLGQYAFALAPIESIDIPKSLNEAGYWGDDGPFVNCDNLKTINFEEGITKIVSNLFVDCPGLEEITIPDTVTVIGSNAFKDCSNLKTVTMSDSVTEINSRAFDNCTSLTSVKLSMGLETLGQYAFALAPIESIDIPKSLNTAETDYWDNDGPFANCNQLRTVNFEEGITKIVSNLFANCPGLKEVTIPDTVTIIDSNAFKNCSGLKAVTMSDSVTEIGYSTFRYCTSLTDVQLSMGLETLGVYAFGDTAIEGIDIPKSLNTAETDYWDNDGPFANCNQLKTVNFEEGITRIVSNLFANCPGLEEVTIPDTVTTIDSNAFKNCSGLKTVTISDSVTEIGYSAFRYCTSLESIEIADSVTVVGDYSFDDCTSLSRIVLSKNLTQLPTFKNCQSLKDIELLTGITSIENSTFINCTSLESITVPEGVERIGEEAFYGCKSLISVSLPKTLKRIEYNAFYQCQSLKEMMIPANTQYIGSQAFYNCKSLTKVEMTDSVTEIGNAAFQNCSVLTDVVLSGNIKTISDSAFRGCSVLTDVVIPDGVENIKDYAFAENVKLVSVTIPESVTEIAANAFSYPKKMTIYGSEGSYAEEYASSKGITFVSGKYTISYDANGGTNAPTSQIKIADESVTLSVDKPLKNGYLFIGWALSNDATEAVYQAGDVFTDNADITLYAVWQKINLISISIHSLPENIIYQLGDTLDTTGLVLIAAYSDSSEKEVTDGFACTPTELTMAGTQKITIEYGDQTASFNVTVNNDYSLTASPDSPQKVGTPITLTAEGGSSYRFYYEQNGRSVTVRDFGTENICVWNPTVPAEYIVYVDISDEAGKLIAVKGIQYTITDAYSFTLDKEGEQNVGVNMTLTATGGASYKFYYEYNGAWCNITSNTTGICEWSPKYAGNYMLYVDIKDETGKVIACRTQAFKLNDPFTLTSDAQSTELPYGKTINFTANGGTSYKF